MVQWHDEAWILETRLSMKPIAKIVMAAVQVCNKLPIREGVMGRYVPKATSAVRTHNPIRINVSLIENYYPCFSNNGTLSAECIQTSFPNPRRNV